MKTIIAGGRTITDYSLVLSAIGESEFEITEVVSGMAPGVDTLAIQYSRQHNLPLKEFHADWNQYRRAAGPIRNREMAEYGEALIAIWDGESRGTKNMIEEATKRGLKVYTDHRNECSGSNDAGQIGSIYGVVDVYSEKQGLQ
jgi:hypothetical protein